MRASRFYIATTKETPNDAELASHRLMLRAGMIRRLGSGLYTWMPLGLRVARKVEGIVREEMDRAGALELLMPAVQPGELWQESGRWEKYGPELLRLTDRHDRDFCVGPTHEEVITDVVRREVRSYRQLPVNFYQVQTKFRDEIRPRFGVMRAREFVMKDAYSFDVDEAGMQASFDRMNDAYVRIFDRLGLRYRAVEADSGSIGGAKSREFHVLADSGEDAIVYASEGDYAANVEKAEAVATAERAAPAEELRTIETPDVHTIDDLARHTGLPPSKLMKTLLVKGSEEGAPTVALCLRGDHELNDIKAVAVPGVASPLEFADPEALKAAANADPGSIGPVGLPVPVVADRDAAAMSDFIVGANETGKHLAGANWGRDCPEPVVADLRNVVEGDPSPTGKGVLHVVRGIEVGHIFQLGDTYSAPLGATVLDEGGRPRTVLMGCYGIGITRIVAAAIEQGNDAAGIVWPEALAPFRAVVCPVNMAKSDAVREAAEALYARLESAGVEVLLDDRPLRPGVMFADMELLGIPHRFVVSDRLLADGKIEYKARTADEARLVGADEAVALAGG